MRSLSKQFIFRKATAILVGAIFLVNTGLPAYAQSVFLLPAPGAQVNLSQGFTPLLLKAVRVHPDSPFEFDFVVDQGDTKFTEEAFKTESQKLIRYFLASLTTPEDELWVNLSPYEKNRIIPESFGVTEMGRDLLAQDYLLKQITATLMYPEGDVGKKFWDRVHKQAFEKFGTSEIPTSTFNKVWIVPQKAVIYENGPTAYIDATHLKVMLEEDYEALSHQKDSAKSPSFAGTGRTTVRDEAVTQDANALGSQIVREIILPELEKEVNQGTHFAPLRQVYNSLILANWYKKRLKDSILAQVYVDKNKVAGVDINDKAETQKIYDRYVEAFKKGVYNYIKEDYDPVSQESIPRKYFSGGVSLKFGLVGSSAVMDLRSGLPAQMTGNSQRLKAVAAKLNLFDSNTLVGQGDDSWAQYSKVTTRQTLQTRLNKLDKMLTLDRPFTDIIISPLQGKPSDIKTIQLAENPLDLLKEIVFYIEDMEAQRVRSGDKILLPEQYAKAKQVFAKLLALALPWYQVDAGELVPDIGNINAEQLNLFMEGETDILRVSVMRNIVRSLEKVRKDPSGAVAISLEQLLFQKVKKENDKETAGGGTPLLTEQERLEDNIAQDRKGLAVSIQRLRTEKGLTSDETARLAGIPQEVFTKYETNNDLSRSVEPSDLLAIAKALDVNVDELWPADDLIVIDFAASSGVGMPEELKNYADLAPEQQTKVKNKYRDQNGNLVVPYRELYNQQRTIGFLSMHPFLGEPVIYVDATLGQPEYAEINSLVVKHYEFVLSRWQEKMRELGLSFAEIGDWIKKNINPDQLIEKQRFAQIITDGSSDEMIRKLIEVRVLKDISPGTVSLKVIELERATEIIKNVTGPYYRQVMSLFKEIQRGGPADIFNEEVDSQEDSYQQAILQYYKISKAQKAAPQPVVTQPAETADVRSPEKVSSSPAKAKNDEVGGIDLSADKTQLDIRSKGAPVEFNFDPKQIQNLKFDGFVPVIINVTPMTNLPVFLTENSTLAPSGANSQIN